MTLRQRTSGVILTLVIEALIILAVLSLGQFSDPPLVGGSLVTLRLGNDDTPEKTVERAKAAAAAPPAQRLAPPPLPKVAKPTNPQEQPPKPSPAFVEVSKADFAAMDISKLGTKKSGSVSRLPASVGPGEGPNGEPLYNAEWVREPTDGELAPYFAEAKSRPAGAWAMIACKTIEHYHVENCQPLGESPLGSGLGKALRKAAWQFLVRPPRVGEKTLTGVWVRIRFDFNKAEADEK